MEATANTCLVPFCTDLQDLEVEGTMNRYEPFSRRRKVDTNTLAIIRQLRSEFEDELNASNYSNNTRTLMRNYVRQFVGWLAGTWSPGDYYGRLTP